MVRMYGGGLIFWRKGITSGLGLTVITSWFLGLFLAQNGVLDDCFEDLSHAV